MGKEPTQARLVEAPRPMNAPNRQLERSGPPRRPQRS